MDSPLPSVEDLQALFLLYCAVGRSQRVVLGSTDGLYGVRLQSAKDIDTMSQKGFEIMARDMPGLMGHPRGASAPLPFIFTSNVGVTKIAMSPGGTSRKSERFELRFDHWLDALKDLAVHVYSREIPPRPGVDQADVALATLLARHVRPLLSKRFLGTDQVGPDPSLDSTQAAAYGLSPSQVADGWDWACANGLVGRPLTTRLVLTEASVKTDVEAVVTGLRGVPLSFKEARDDEKYAMRLRARLTSFTQGEAGVGAAAYGQGSPGMAAVGLDDGPYGRGGASAASSSIQLSLSPSLANAMAPSTRDKVHALSALAAGGGDGAGSGGLTPQAIGPATAAALLSRPGHGPSPLSRSNSMRVPSGGLTSAGSFSLGHGGSAAAGAGGVAAATQPSYSAFPANALPGAAHMQPGQPALHSVGSRSQLLPALPVAGMSSTSALHTTASLLQSSGINASALQHADPNTLAMVNELASNLQQLLNSIGQQQQQPQQVGQAAVGH